MNKLLFALGILSGLSSLGQRVTTPNQTSPPPPSVPTDTLGTGLEAIPVVVNEDSYAEEYRKDRFRTSFGLRIGVSKTQINTSSGDVIRISPNGLPVITNGGFTRDQIVSNSAFGTGYQASAFIRITRGSFFHQPELTYATKGGKFDFLDREGNLLNRVDAKFKAIDIPLLLGVRFRNARIFAGPQLSYAMQKNEAFETSLHPYTTSDFNSDFFKKPVLNTIVGLGFQFKSFFFDLRYENGIGNYAETSIGPANSPKPFSFTTDQFIFSLGILK